MDSIDIGVRLVDAMGGESPPLSVTSDSLEEALTLADFMLPLLVDLMIGQLRTPVRARRTKSGRVIVTLHQFPMESPPNMLAVSVRTDRQITDRLANAWRVWLSQYDTKPGWEFAGYELIISFPRGVTRAQIVDDAHGAALRVLRVAGLVNSGISQK